MDVYSDFKKWLKGSSVHHSNEFWIRVLLVIPVILLFVSAHSYPISISFVSWEVFLKTTPVVFIMTGLMLGSFWWVMFDGWYNMKRRNHLLKTGAPYYYYKGFTWWYIGSDDGDKDAFLDRLQRWLGPTFSKVVKIGSLVGSIFLYVYTSIK